MNRRSFVLRLAALSLFCIACGSRADGPKNVILMVGDGMGPVHIEAAGLYSNGARGSLFLESLPRKAMVTTCSAYTVPPTGTATPKVTDSAAAGTAMAAGRKVYNGVLSVALPGDGAPLPTALEILAKAGKKTGLVTTSFLTDATPSAFGAHVKARAMHKEIAADYLAKSRPNLLLGAADKDKNPEFTPDKVRASGYWFIEDRKGLKGLAAVTNAHVLGFFGAGPMCYEFDYANKTRKDYDRLPHLTEMTAAALEFLSRETAGFFLMVEGACVDKASHGNHLGRAVYETLEFDRAVKEVVTWASNRTDTLVLVTADHETGGLKVVKDNGKGKLPDVKWASKGHSGADVNLYAMGPGSEKIEGLLDNTDVFRLLTGTFETPFRYEPPVAVPGEAKPPKSDDKD